MAKQVLPTNFMDDILNESMNGKRRWTITQNDDGTYTLEDATTYDQLGNTFGQAQVNAMNKAIKPDVDGDISGWQYTSCGEIPGIKGDVDLDVAYEDPAAWTQPTGESRVILCVSIADTYDKAVAENISAAYPGCKVHRVQALDAGGIEMWVASVADVWTREQAEILRQQFEAMGINGIIHEVRIVE